VTKDERNQVEYAIHELKAHLEFTTDPTHRPKVERVVTRLEELLAEYIKGWVPRVDPKCPRCDGEMTERKTKLGGRKFWGCTRWPQCPGTLSYMTKAKKVKGT